MSVIVNDNMPIDLALRLLWREATRERIIQTLQENKYYIPDSFKAHQVRRLIKKGKRRRRTAARRMSSK